MWDGVFCNAVSHWLGAKCSISPVVYFNECTIHSQVHPRSNASARSVVIFPELMRICLRLDIILDCILPSLIHCTYTYKVIQGQNFLRQVLWYGVYYFGFVYILTSYWNVFSLPECHLRDSFTDWQVGNRVVGAHAIFLHVCHITQLGPL